MYEHCEDSLAQPYELMPAEIDSAGSWGWRPLKGFDPRKPWRLQFDWRINTAGWSAGCAFGLFGKAQKWPDAAAVLQGITDAGRATSMAGGGEVAWFGGITLVLGLVYLAWVVNLRSAVVGALAWSLYILVYTPLKKRTTANTAIGAISGALPALIGWAATGTEPRLEIAVLFVIIYLWQFPHFMAIAWRYRDDYA